MQLPTKILLALLSFCVRIQAGASGTGSTTRYWDCCKTSCAWSGKATLLSGSGPVTTCDISDNPLTDANAQSGCNGGSAYMCSDQSPWAVTDDLAYGYAAVSIAGGSESSWCCACYELSFTSEAVAGKKMIVQATNTGSDLAINQFDLSIPGGGVGIFNGCTAEWGAPSSGWGAQYGGISSRSDCDSFPEKLKAGCQWRFDWFGGSDNPTVSFTQVSCPAALTANTNCVRADDGSAAPPAPPATPKSSVADSSKATSTAQGATSETPVPSSQALAKSSPASILPSSAGVVTSETPTLPTDIRDVSETLENTSSVPLVTSSVAPTLMPTASAVPGTTSPDDEQDDDTCDWEL